ncbi:MAG: hypothetical protein ACH37Z_06670 [Anaerolineae bacterium]
MNLQSAIQPIIETTAIITTIALALRGYTISRRNELELTRRRERLEHINRSLNDFYGPLYVLSEVGQRAYSAFLHKMGGEGFFEESPMKEDRLNEWFIWVEEIFIPLNQIREDLIIQNAHLIREEEFPESMLIFITHAALYKAMLAKWKQNDHQEYLPAIDYPVELGEYTRKSYRELKHEQLGLIGKTEKTVL